MKDLEEELLPIARLLVETNPDCVTVRSSEWGTPLHKLFDELIGPEALPFARLLVEARPECLEMLDNEKRTPLHVFC